MARQPKPKRGRPRMRERSVWFGMKLSEMERDSIKRRARSQGKTMSSYIRTLIDRDVAPMPAKKRLTGKELMALPQKERHRLLAKQAKSAAA